MAEEGAASKKGKKVRSREKKQRKGRKHESVKVWKFYEAVQGQVNRKKKSCPRCGQGTFLAEHKNRLHCGRCGYTQSENVEQKG